MAESFKRINTHGVKVLHLITTLEIGGAETQLFRLLTSSSRKQFQYSVVSLTSLGRLGKKIESLDVPVYALGMKRGIPSPRAIWELWRILQIEQPAVIQTWMYHADLLGLMAKLMRGRRLVWNIRCSNMDMRYYRSLTSWVVKVLSKLSRIPDAVVANSYNGMRAHQQKGYQPKIWRVIPNGLDLNLCGPSSLGRDLIRRELGLSQDTVLIGLIARYDPMKDHETFLAAAGLLHETYPSVHFVLCGKNIDWDNPTLGALIRKNSLEGVMHLLGERDDAVCVTAACDIACSTSAFGEGFSNAIAEAMACGVVCVATKVGDSSEIIGPCGRIVPPKDPDAIMKAWVELIDVGMKGRQVFGAEARNRVFHHFDVKKTVEQYEALYESLAGINEK